MDIIILVTKLQPFQLKSFRKIHILTLKLSTYLSPKGYKISDTFHNISGKENYLKFVCRRLCYFELNIRVGSFQRIVSNKSIGFAGRNLRSQCSALNLLEDIWKSVKWIWILFTITVNLTSSLNTARRTQSFPKCLYTRSIHLTMNRNNRRDRAGGTPSYGDFCQCGTILQFSDKLDCANICLWCTGRSGTCRTTSRCSWFSLSFCPPQAFHSRWCDPNQSVKRSQNFKARRSIGSENLIKNFVQLTSNDWKAPLGDTNSHYLRRFAHHHD